MTVVPVARQFRQPNGNSPAPGAESLLAWDAAAAAPVRFSTNVTGPVAGASVRAPRPCAGVPGNGRMTW